MILAFKVNSALKCLVLGQSLVNRRLKAIRFRSINLPGRVLERGGAFRSARWGHPQNEIPFEARRRVLSLCYSG